MNLSQSTNDVYPTAVKLALHHAIEELRDAMRKLVDAFLAKGKEFSSFVKMGRTQLQDAVPMTLGQEFGAFGHTMQEDVDRLGEAQALIREINMGATAIGTGINAPPRLRRDDPPRAVADHRSVADHGAGSGRGDVRHRRVRADVGRAQALRGEAVEDLQ